MVATFEDCVKKIKSKLNAKNLSVIMFVFGMVSAAVMLTILGVNFVSAKNSINGEQLTAVKLNGFSLIYLLFNGGGELGVYAGKFVEITVGVLMIIMFLTALLVITVSACGFMESSKKLVRMQVILHGIYTACLVLLLIFFIVLKNKLASVFGLSTEVRSISLMLMELPIIFLIAFSAIALLFSPDYEKDGVRKNVKIAPIMLAAIAVVMLGTVMFSSATLMTNGAVKSFNMFVSAAKKGDAEGQARAYFATGSYEYADFIKNYKQNEDISTYKEIKFNVERQKQNYALLNVNTTDNNGEKKTVKAHYYKLATGWYLMTPFTFKQGNTYDGGTLLIEKLRYDYRQATNDYAVVGIMNTDSESLSSIVIPSTYRGRHVATVESYAFANLKELKKLTVRNGVVAINEGSFSNCPNLKDISLPKNIINENSGI